MKSTELSSGLLIPVLGYIYNINKHFLNSIFHFLPPKKHPTGNLYNNFFSENFQNRLKYSL